MSTTLRDVALAAHHAGIAVLPPREDGTKRPIGQSWEQYQRTAPSLAQVEQWYPPVCRRTGMGVVPGAVSDNLEMLEWEDEATYRAYKDAAALAGLTPLVERIENGYLEATPGGGFHWLYRCSNIAGNTKLARRPKRPEEQRHAKDRIAVLIETRGEGGYVVVAPSHGRVHPSGNPYRLLRGSLSTIVTITPEERTALFDLARSFDQLPRPVAQGATRITGRDRRPGDDFNRLTTWPDVLEPHGWTSIGERGETTLWRRPGKNIGISATTNFGGSDQLFVFSTATEFDAERAYDRFAAYAVLNHASDFQAAARALAQQGYGAPASGAAGSAPNDDAVDAAFQASATVSWPVLHDDALYGLPGRIVRSLLPQTEADPVALLLSLLAAFGNAAGSGVWCEVGPKHHPLRVWPVLVGSTSKGRKGTSWDPIEALLRLVDPDWVAEHRISGLSSGEGLIWSVRDAVMGRERVKAGGSVTYQEVESDPGVLDKRLMTLETEFSSVLKLATREGSILGEVLRQAWDSGDLHTLVKNSPNKATGAHITVMGHITLEELRRHLSETEAANGTGNRLVWACVRRSKKLPEGGDFAAVDMAGLAEELGAALDFARSAGVLRRDEDARALWAEVYGELSDAKPGLTGAMCSRAEAQALRLSGLYAVMDRSTVITPDHLRAALALWDYCEHSARFIFGDSLGDPVADTILQALRRVDKLTRTQITDLLGRHCPAARLQGALRTLLSLGLAERQIVNDTGGRPAEEWRAMR